MQLCNPDDSRIIPFTPVQLALMGQMYRDGSSSRMLSAKYGISQKAVLRRLRAMEIEIRGVGSCREAARLRGEL